MWAWRKARYGQKANDGMLRYIRAMKQNSGITAEHPVRDYPASSRDATAFRKQERKDAIRLLPFRQRQSAPPANFDQVGQHIDGDSC